jgi:ferredoxin
MHMVRSPENMKEREGALKALVKCREAGKIGHIGLSAHGVSGTAVALDYSEIEVVLPIVNRKGLGIIDGDLGQMIKIVRKMKDRGIGLYDMKPLGGGHLIDDIPSSIEYVRSLSLFDSIAVGLKTPEEVEIMVGVFEGHQKAIDKALEIGPLRAQQKRLHIYRTCRSCGNCVSACAQGALYLGETSAEVIREKCILCGYCASACPVFAIRVV